MGAMIVLKVGYILARVSQRGRMFGEVTIYLQKSDTYTATTGVLK